MKDEISFRYFYEMFKEEFRKNVAKLEMERIGKEEYDDLSEIFDMYITASLTKEERISIYDQILFEVCASYVSLSEADITIYPKNSFEFLQLILNNMHKNPYKESFLLSMQFIFQDYFKYLEKGCPMLFSSSENGSPNLQITLDSQNKIAQFDSVDMDLEEQDTTMLGVLMLEKNHQIGPVPNVKYRYRKDI